MDTEGQLSLREKPDQRVVMRQSWDDLLFLHWEVNPDLIQATLPAGLNVDTFEGKTYLGIVPFFMRKVRPVGLPAIPWLSDFMECNLRTYVTGPEGPGVWFYSLDCNQPIAVEIARHFFHLPYFHAEMNSGATESGKTEYSTKRLYKSGARRLEKTSQFRYRGKGTSGPAKSGDLDFFLIERYLLYSSNLKKNRLYSARVWHTPYRLGGADVENFDTQLIEVAGFSKPDRPPECIHHSKGVDVEIYGLKQC